MQSSEGILCDTASQRRAAGRELVGKFLLLSHFHQPHSCSLPSIDMDHLLSTRNSTPLSEAPDSSPSS